MVLEIHDRIRSRTLRFFDGFEIQYKYDSVGSTFKFNFLFDPDNIEHKELACIGHYHIATLKDGEDILMTGIVLSQVFNDGPEASMVSIAGYSLPGVLQDCEIPFGTPSSWIITPRAYTKKFSESTWPNTLESSGVSLEDLVKKIIHPFGLKMVIDSSVASAMQEAYDETTAEEKETALSYICKLAAQKNIIVTDNQFGNLVFTRPGNQKPIFHFDSNMPGTRYTLKFDGQRMHSHIKAYQQQDIEDNIPASENLVENPYVPYVFRPHVVVQTSGDSDDTLNVAKNVRAKELKNLELTIQTDRWRVNNRIFRKGDIISVTNKNVYLYKKSDWFVEEVALKGDAKEAVATMKCVQKSVYDGSDPTYLFEGINLH